MYYRFGNKGDTVRKIQLALEIEPIDGIYGRMTEAAVKNYQKKNKMHPDGVVTPELLTKLLDEEYTTDLQESKGEKFNFTRYWLNDNEYSKSTTIKGYLFLHHTAGSHNPYNTIDIWERDKRGAIATEFVIGGVGLNGDTQYDGEVLQAFPEGHWGYHLGNVDRHMHYHSVGIELCNYGPLKEKRGSFYTIYGQKVEPEYVTDLGYKFRGSRFYHSYTDNQIESCKNLIKYLQERDKFDVNRGLKEYLNKFDADIAFEYYNEAVEGKIPGILSHTNVRKDKSDVYPHPKLIDMIMSL